MGELQTYPRIVPFLWFDANAEEAVNFYLSVFPNSSRLEELRNGDSILTIAFELDGQKFTALNGGPMYKFNEAVSFVIRCETQKEIDNYWTRLSAGGSEGPCGWLKDKYGLSWQVIPPHLPTLIRHPNALQAMLRMKKLDIAQLQAAATA